MTVFFLADIETVPDPIRGGVFRRPKFDRAGVTAWTMQELRNTKCLVRAEGINTAPVDAQTIGNVGKTTVVDTALAIKIRDYFDLTLAEGLAAVGKMFGEVVYHLMLVKPAVKNGRRTLIVGEEIHSEVES